MTAGAEHHHDGEQHGGGVDSDTPHAEEARVRNQAESGAASVVPLEHPDPPPAEAAAVTPDRKSPQIRVRFADLPSPIPAPSRTRRIVIIVIAVVLAAAAFAAGLWWADSQRTAANESNPGPETVLVLRHT